MSHFLTCGLFLGSVLSVAAANAAVTEIDLELLNAVNRNQAARVQTLLTAGANVNIRHPPLQLTPLIVASDVNFNADKKISLKIVKLLITRGANVNVHDRDGLTPLMKAIGSYNLLVVTYLLDSGADVNAKDQRGHTPLTHAIMRSQSQILSLLIERGARLDVQGDMGTTPWSIAQNMRAAAQTMPEHVHDTSHAHPAQNTDPSVIIHAPPPHAMRSKDEALAQTQAVLDILEARGAIEPQRPITHFDAMAAHRH